MNASPVAAVVRSWVELYTRGMPAPLRTARRDEVDDDLWCQREEAMATGRSQRSLGAELLLRLVLGIPADLSWRLTYGRHEAAADLERDSSMGTRVLGVLAMVAGASWAISASLILGFGVGIWSGPSAPLLVALGLGGAVAFAGATIGMALRFQDQLSTIGGLAGVLSGLGAFFGAAGGYGGYALLPVGSAVLIWDLARRGVLSRAVATVHGVGALAFLVSVANSLIDYRQTVTNPAFVALAIPYMLSWLPIGASLLRGVPLAHGRHPG